MPTPSGLPLFSTHASRNPYQPLPSSSSDPPPPHDDDDSPSLRSNSSPYTHPYSHDYEANRASIGEAFASRLANSPRSGRRFGLLATFAGDSPAASSIKGALVTATRWRGTKQKVLWVAAALSLVYLIHTIKASSDDHHAWHPHFSKPDPNLDLDYYDAPVDAVPDAPPDSQLTGAPSRSDVDEIPLSANLTAFVQPRRKIRPSTPDPWADVQSRTFLGRDWLSVERFGSTELGWKGMRDPPERPVPPARYLVKAFEYAARSKPTRDEVDAKRKEHEAARLSGKEGLTADDLDWNMGPGTAWDERTGRPKMVSRKDLKLGEYFKWNPEQKGYRVSDLGTGGMRERKMAKVQADGVVGESRDEEAKREKEREERRDWVKRAFLHAWEGYKKHAWGHDELAPVSNLWSDNYNGWGATLVDNLDTLLLMNLSHEYNLAREHVASIDFTYLVPSSSSFFHTRLPELHSLDVVPDPRVSYKDVDATLTNKFTDPRLAARQNPRSPSTVPLFETTIRYLGGLLSAYDLSGGDPLMLERARELGDWLLPSLATMYGLAVPRYAIGSNPNGGPIGRAVLAEVGSLTLELTKLSMITGDETYYKAAQRTMDTLEHHFKAASPKPVVTNTGKVRGRLGTLLPSHVNPDQPNMVQGEYTFGGLADSYYEYLIKQAQLTSFSHPQYPRMYENAIESAYKYLVRPIETVPGRDGLTNIGTVNWGAYRHELQHLTCFAGGMLGLGAKLLDRPKDMETALNFTEACVWVYESSATGVGGESTTFYLKDDPSRWVVKADEDGNKTREPRGSPAGVRTGNRRQIGRPETIESVFYMWRLTGDRYWQDRGWQMFTSWVEHSITDSGFATIADVNVLPASKDDSMESFVTAETLKYYYLLFSPRDFISLDDYTFNTEAHPLWIPKPSSSSSASSSSKPGSRLPPEPLWTGPEVLDGAASSAGFVEQRGEGTWVQKWARIQQASRLAGTLRVQHDAMAKKADERPRPGSTDDEGESWDEDDEVDARGQVVAPVQRRPPIRPSEEELEQARKKEAADRDGAGGRVPGPVQGGGGRGIGGAPPPPR